jgi:hypothetical protein
MEKAGGTPVIHRFQHKKDGVDRDHRDHKEDRFRDRNTETADNTRKYIDTQCPLCKSYGHPKYQCDRMALYLHLQDGAKLLDDKLKMKIQANYADVDAKRRSRKMAKLRGTVRQLFQAGDYQEGEKLIEKVLGPTTQEPTLIDNSDLEASHSS